MREIVLDTETTGLDPKTGDRLCEIAGIEIINHIPTGARYHVFINPERDMPAEAFKVHGLSAEFLADHPVFALHVEEFLAFVRGARLVIHNAEFDMRFINHELGLLQRPPILMDDVVDTLAMARRRHPGAPNSLDALCARYRIDTSKRVKHGAMIDVELLAEVYAELCGGRQTSFGLGPRILQPQGVGTIAVPLRRPAPLPPAITAAEEAAHAAFVAEMGAKALWLQYTAAPDEQRAATG
jgi:DNA polymerase III subunit epsilon